MESICALLLCQINLILLLSPFNSFHCEFRVSTQIIALQNKQGLLMASWATFFLNVVTWFNGHSPLTLLDLGYKVLVTKVSNVILLYHYLKLVTGK